MLFKFILKQNKLFGINRDKHLWSYEITSKEIDILHKITEPKAFISDTREGAFLFTFSVDFKKELLEFDINH